MPRGKRRLSERSLFEIVLLLSKLVHFFGYGGNARNVIASQSSVPLIYKKNVIPRMEKIFETISLRIPINRQIFLSNKYLISQRPIFLRKRA